MIRRELSFWCLDAQLVGQGPLDFGDEWRESEYTLRPVDQNVNERDLAHFKRHIPVGPLKQRTFVLS